MAKLKPSKKYYFSVEGETEQWYLYHLRDIINKEETSAYKVSLDCSIQKNPLKRAKYIMRQNQTDLNIAEYKGYTFYRENPSLTVWEAIDKILTDCKV